MSDPEILDRIDGTLDEWDTWSGHSPDAARWAGEPEESERIRIDVSALVESYGQALRLIGESMLAAFREIAKVLQAEPPPQPRPKRRTPTPAAERTRSARWRAGSRRTKRQARRRQ